MRRLDRYVLREILGPLTLGFLVYTSLLVIQLLFKTAEMIIRKGLPLSVMGEIVLLSLPNIVVLTIPMALLFGILIAVGRLSSDSEIVALRASGVGLSRLYRPILLLSTVLTVANLALSVWVLPWGNHRLIVRQLELGAQSVSSQVQPRVFYDQWTSKTLYVFEVDPETREWSGVFVADSNLADNSVQRSTLAQRGRVEVDAAGERVVLKLENAVVHELDPKRPERYNISKQAFTEVVLTEQLTTDQRAKINSAKGVRELSIPELKAWARDVNRTREDRKLARVEIQKKLSIPCAGLVFGILALPLGAGHRRSGRSAGFALSLLVILVYWVLISMGEESARAGRMSAWVAMWGPNLLLTGAGFWLLRRRNHDQPLLPQRFTDPVVAFVTARLRSWVLRLRALLPHRRRDESRREPRPASAAGAGTQIVIRVARMRPSFPNLLDRYVARVFGMVFMLTLASGLILYVVADFTEKASEILKAAPAFTAVLDYYKYLSLDAFFRIAPILVLVTTLITFALLSRSNEVTAAKALGISVFRLAVPALCGALAVTGFSAYLQSVILPAANERMTELASEIRGRQSTRTQRRADRQWLFGQDRYIYHYRTYDPKKQSLERLQVFEFDDQQQLVGRLFADRATYDQEGLWDFEHGWQRRFVADSQTEFQAFPGVVKARYPERPEFFSTEVRKPEQMTYGELRQYIEDLERSGQTATKLKVELQNKIAYPAISLVMALVALPFAFRLGRQGALYGVGLSIVLGMSFLVVYLFFIQLLGETGVLPPAVAAWGPNVIFALWSAYLFLGVRT